MKKHYFYSVGLTALLSISLSAFAAGTEKTTKTAKDDKAFAICTPVRVKFIMI